MDAYHATAIHRLHSIWLSFRNLPHWLQGWVFLILMPLNGASLFFLDTFSGQAITLALFLVLAVNLHEQRHVTGAPAGLDSTGNRPAGAAGRALGRRSPGTGTMGFHPCGIHGQRHQPVLRCSRCLVLGPGRSPDPPPGSQLIVNSGAGVAPSFHQVFNPAPRLWTRPQPSKTTTTLSSRAANCPLSTVN